MTKVLKSKSKICRRLGQNLWGRAKDPSLKKNYRPGMHGPVMQKKVSDYGRQLNAKQALKNYYGRIREKQFKAIFDEAVRLKGDTNENLIGLLERRLDAIIYRLNFSSTIFGARQLVSHKHVKVNGEVVNIPSYVVKEGDTIELTDNAKNFANVIVALDVMERDVPEYLTLDVKKKSAKFIRTPKFLEVPYPIKMEPNLVVEYYSR